MSEKIKNDENTLPLDYVSNIFSTIKLDHFGLSEFINSIQTTCETLNTRQTLIYISNRSTQDIIEDIELLCETILSNFLDIKTKDDKALHFLVYNYLIYFTKFEKINLLRMNTDYNQMFQKYNDKQLFISPYLFMEIVWQLHYDAFLAESMLYLPVDLCAEILDILPRCILMLDFSRALKFITTIVINIYKKLDSLHNNLNVSMDIIPETKKLVDNLSETFFFFISKKFLECENLHKMDVHKRCGIVLKALLRMTIKCLKPKSIPYYDMQKKYSSDYLKKLPSEIFMSYRKDVHALFIDVLLRIVQSIDCNCYLDWTEFDDEDQPAWSLQRAVGIECHYFLEYTQNYFSGETYELLVTSLKQISSTPLPENIQIIDKSILHLDTVYTDLLQDMIECFLNKINENEEIKDVTNITFLNYAKKINKLMAKINNDQLINFIHLFVVKIIGDGETQFRKLNCESYDLSINENNFYNFDESDPLNLLFKDPERRIEQDYKRLLIRLFFQPEDTIEKIAQLAIGHGNYKLMDNFSFENIDLIVDVLKIQVPNAFNDLLKHLMKRAGIEGEEKADIMKLNKTFRKEDRLTIPLAVKILQKIAIKAFSSNQSHLSICLKTLIEKGIASIDLITEELLIPLLLVPSYALDPILFYFQTIVNVYKSQHLLYHKLLVRLLKKLPYERSCDRYHVSKLLGRVHDLLERVFNELSFETLTAKVSRYRYNKFIFDNAYDSFLSESLIHNVLRHELLYASELHCLKYVEELLVKGGHKLLSKDSTAEVYDMLIQIIFEACLLSLEFAERFPPKTSKFIFNLLPPILRITRKCNYTKVCQSLNKHANGVGLTYIMMLSTFKNRWENIIKTWDSMLIKEKVEDKDWMTLLDIIIIRDDEDLQLLKIESKSPFGLQFFLSENIISYLDSKEFISKLNDRFECCFDLIKKK